MLKILTFGVYDMLHIGHMLLFKHIKEYFPDQECKLIVAVQDGDCILKYKPGTKMIYSTEERMFMVSAVRWVDEVITYKDVDIDEKIDKLIIENIYNYRLSGCSFLIPTNAFKSLGGFREDIRTVSDVEYWHRLMFNGYHFYCLKNNVLVSNRSHGKQVGKTKVRLFHKELNELYVYIVDN